MRINISLDEEVLKKLDSYADKAGKNRSSMITQMVNKYINIDTTFGKGLHFYTKEDIETIIEMTGDRFKDADHFFNSQKVAYLNNLYRLRPGTVKEAASVDDNGVVNIKMNDAMKKFMEDNNQ